MKRQKPVDRSDRFCRALETASVGRQTHTSGCGQLRRQSGHAQVSQAAPDIREELDPGADDRFAPRHFRRRLVDFQPR
jgi:hypothetical protein